MQKVLFFGQRSEFLSTVIKSSLAKLWGKVTGVFSTSIFVQNCQFFGEKNLKFCEKF